MFPLSSVLFPGGLLPLRVFEPRYKQMIEHCLDGDRRFGVVLISRGPEVGGGDERYDTGTCARILQVGELEGDHLLVLAAGEERVRAVEWLPDDPYPQAQVVPAPDDGSGEPPAGALAAAARSLRRVLALAAELGATVGSGDFELAAEPGRASYQLAALAPLTPLDAQRVLETADPAARVELLGGLLDDAADLLRARLGAG